MKGGRKERWNGRKGEMERGRKEGKEKWKGVIEGRKEGKKERRKTAPLAAVVMVG
jgi:hypothetical protein